MLNFSSYFPVIHSSGNLKVAKKRKWENKNSAAIETGDAQQKFTHLLPLCANTSDLNC